MENYGMTGPVLALAAWTFLIWLWMYATRIPAMSAAKIDPQAAKHPGSLSVLPAGARQVADNYNHLHEQPTVFYAVALAAQVAGLLDPMTIGFAWLYVGLRVAHSLVQCTVNSVPVRFLLFALATFALIALTARAAWLLLSSAV
jgi:hypothetical protein